jgi:hypothetical protein
MIQATKDAVLIQIDELLTAVFRKNSIPEVSDRIMAIRDSVASLSAEDDAATPLPLRLAEAPIGKEGDDVTD